MVNLIDATEEEVWWSLSKIPRSSAFGNTMSSFALPSSVAYARVGEDLGIRRTVLRLLAHAHIDAADASLSVKKLEVERVGAFHEPCQPRSPKKIDNYLSSFLFPLNDAANSFIRMTDATIRRESCLCGKCQALEVTDTLLNSTEDDLSMQSWDTTRDIPQLSLRLKVQDVSLVCPKLEGSSKSGCGFCDILRHVLLEFSEV